MPSKTNRSTPGVRSDAIFKIFCVWTFVYLCRPQDIFPALAAVRPALLTSVLMLLAVLFRFNELQKNPSFREGQVRLYAALVAIMIAGIPTSLYVRRSFEMVFTDYVNVVLFFLIFFKVVDSIERISRVLLVGCLGNGLYSAFTVLTGSFGHGRLYFGGMFDPNDLSFFALSFMPLNLIFTGRGNPLWIRSACLGSFGIGFLLILLTGSRGGLIALAIVVALLLLTRTQAVKPVMKFFFVILGIVSIAFAPINWERYGTILDLKEDYNVYDETGRMGIWKIGMRALMENPVTGTGVETFYMAVGQDREKRGLPTHTWQAAHNMVVQIGTETGVIGLVLFLLMSFNVFRIFYRVRANSCSMKLIQISEMGIAGFLGLFVSGMFLSQAYSLYWAFYIVLSAAVNRVSLSEERYKLGLRRPEPVRAG